VATGVKEAQHGDSPLQGSSLGPTEFFEGLICLWDHPRCQRDWLRAVEGHWRRRSNFTNCLRYFQFILFYFYIWTMWQGFPKALYVRTLYYVCTCNTEFVCKDIPPYHRPPWQDKTATKVSFYVTLYYLLVHVSETFQQPLHHIRPYPWIRSHRTRKSLQAPKLLTVAYAN
jgi:hypothetical protein